MPTLYSDIDSYARRCWIVKEAERQVRAKFPALARGSSGWYRAVENRKNRIYCRG